MADGTGLFSNLLGNASTYFDISRVFPGIEQFLDIEKSIKNINAQLGQTSKISSNLGKITGTFLSNAKSEINTVSKEWGYLRTGIESSSKSMKDFLNDSSTDFQLFGKSLEESNEGIDSSLSKVTKTAEDYSKSTKNILGDSSTEIQLVGKSWEESNKVIDSSLSKTTKTVENYSTGLEEAAKSTEKVSNSNKNLREILYMNSFAYGLSIEKMTEMSLEAIRFNQTLGEDGVRSLTAFSDATGMNAYSIGNFYAKMQATGALTEMSFEKMSASILGAREKYGLATESLYDLFEITEKYAMVVGATEDKLIRATSRMVEFISAMNSAGVESRTAADLLDKIIDPDRMQENYLLLSKMGLTMEELNFGDPMENIQESLPKLKKIAEDIVSIPSRIAANEISKMYGYSLEEMRKFAGLEFNEAEIQRQKNTMEYRKEIQTALDGFENIKNSLFGGIAMFFNKFISPITNALGPTSTAIFGVAMFGIMKKIGNMFKKISRSFADDIGKGVRYALTTSAKQKVLGGGSSGIAEGLLESESRLQDTQKQAEDYKKTAGINNKKLVQLRQEIAESVLGRDLTRVEKEIAAREEFNVAKGKPAKKGKKFSIEDELNFARQKVLEVEKQREEIEELSRIGAIPKISADKILDSLDHEVTNNKNYINNLLATTDSQKAYETVFGQDSSRLEKAKKDKYRSEVEIAYLENNIAKLKTEGKYSDVKIAEELLGIENKNLASYNDEIKNLENTTSMFKKASLEAQKKDIEVKKVSKISEIAAAESLIASGNLDEATKKVKENEIAAANAEIKRLEGQSADLNRIEALTVETMEKTNVTTKALKKAQKISDKKKKIGAKNKLLGLDIDANAFQRGKKKFTTSMTSGFTGMVRGASTGGIKGAIGGAVSGMSMAMPAILGISAAVGGILALSKKSDKFNKETARLTKAAGQFTEYIGTKIGDTIAPFVGFIAKGVEKLVGKIVDTEETKDENNDLREFYKADIEIKNADKEQSFAILKGLNEQIYYLNIQTKEIVQASTVTAQTSLDQMNG